MTHMELVFFVVKLSLINFISLTTKVSCDASRLWWVLKNYGFENLKILNGGLTAWNEMDGELTTEGTITQASDLRLPEISPMSLYVNKEEMLTFVNEINPPLIFDTRTVNEYYGAQQKSGAKQQAEFSVAYLWIRPIALIIREI